LRTDPLLDRFLASMTGAGSLSLLYVAQQNYASILLLLGKAVAAPMTPKLALRRAKTIPTSIDALTTAGSVSCSW